MIVLIDNYDSFTYNIYHYLLHYRDDVRVVRNTEPISLLKGFSHLEALVLSPGPSHPSNSALTLDAIDFFAGRLPIFGVCLGMQAIGYYFGAPVRAAKRIMHGKLDRITFKPSPIFKGCPQYIEVVRYHSLVIDPTGDLTVTARSVSDDEIMAIERGDLGIYGVQFHPESYLTSHGLEIIGNFLEVVDG